MRRIKTDPTRTLTDRQKYLLNRIPSSYQLNGYHAPAEPAAVKAARRLVERYDKRIARERCAADKRKEALIRKAREVVYFGSEQKALAVVHQVEKLLKPCEV